MSTVGELTERIACLKQAGDSGEIQPLLARSQPLRVRRVAALALVELADGPAFDSLGRLMARPEPGLSEEILLLLARLPGANGAKVVARGLAAEDPFWRYRVIGLLASRSDPEALALLLPACRDANLPVKRYAARAIQKILDHDPERVAGLAPAKLDRLLELLEFDLSRCCARIQGGPLALRCAAVRRLGRLGGAAAHAELARTCQDSEPALVDAALSVLESTACAAQLFASLVSHADPDLRRRALCAIAQRDEALARIVLEPALGDCDPGVRLAAARAFCQCVGEEALSAVSGLLADSEPAIRQLAIRTLAGWTAERIRPLLRQAIEDPDEVVARRALVGLARAEVFDADLVERYAILLHELAGRAELDREAIDDFCQLADCFGRQGGLQASAALEVYVTAGHSSALRLRRVAVEAIARFPAGLMIEGLCRLANSRDRVILRSVALKLGEAGHPEGLVPLIRLHHEVSGRTADRALALLKQYYQLGQIDFLLELLTNEWSAVKRFVAERLCQIDDERMIDPLLRAMDDDDMELQFLAVLALGKYTMHEKVTDKMTAKVELGDLPVRQMAVDALGAAKATKAVPVLIRSMGNPFLRPRVEKALAAIGDRRGKLAVKRRKLRDAYIAQHRPSPARGTSVR